MNNSIDNGGTTHIRYAHYHYPRVVDLKCPKCQEKAFASNKDAPTEIEHFIDIASFEKIWNVKCTNCDFRSAIGWESLSQLELWLKTDIRGIEFWAWNSGHLNMILMRLKKENLNANPWESFATYIPGKWLSKLSNEREIKKIKNLLQQNS